MIENLHLSLMHYLNVEHNARGLNTEILAVLTSVPDTNSSDLVINTPINYKNQVGLLSYSS